MAYKKNSGVTIDKQPYKGGATASKIGTYKGGATITKTNRKTGQSSTTRKSLTNISADQFKSNSGKMLRKSTARSAASSSIKKKANNTTPLTGRAKVNGNRKLTY